MVFITGHMGYIGNQLYMKFPDAVGIDWVMPNQNIVDIILKSTKNDVMYHLAAQTDVQTSQKEPLEDARTNILGTINLLSQFKGKIIYTASAASVDPQSPYGISKLAAEHYIKAMSNNFVIVRLPNVYGNSGRGVLDIWAKEETITIFGDGQQTRDFVHVEDIVEGLVLAKDWATGEYSMGSGHACKLIDVATETGKPIIYEPAKEGEIMHSVLPNTTPNWEPTRGLGVE